MQPTNRPKISELPVVVQTARVLMFIAWALFFAVQAGLYGTVSIFHISFAGLFFMLVFSYRNMGRILCALYQLVLAAVLFRQAFYGFFGDPNVLLRGVNALLFFLSAVFLLLPQTALFFRNVSFRNLKN